MKKIVLESPSFRDKKLIQKYLNKRYQVYVIEPFCAYHLRGPIRFFPAPLPGFIEKYIEEGRIELITAEQLDAPSLFFWAPETAVQNIEKIYPQYRKRFAPLIQFLVGQLGEEAELAFKKNLCDRLGAFFSTNNLLHRLEDFFAGELVCAVPHMDVAEYLLCEDLVSQSGGELFRNRNVYFSELSLKKSLFNKILKNCVLSVKLILQTVLSFFLAPFFDTRKKEIKEYRYGVNIVSGRQLRGNQRGADFLVDNRLIRAEEVVYLPRLDIDSAQKEYIERLGSDVFFPPKVGRFFSNWTVWARLSIKSVARIFSAYPDVTEVVAVSLFTYFRWEWVFKRISIKHFITHCDFSTSNIARNLLLKRRGVTTWYFTDSAGFGSCFRESNNNWNRHPFWSYLKYDKLITWSNDISEYFSRHPETFKEVYVVGNLWAGHVDLSVDKRKYLSEFFDEKELSNKFLIVVYASTYSVKSITPYEEALEFVNHIKMIAEEFSDVLILLKEKKDEKMHLRLDPELGAELIRQYKILGSHPRIKVCSNKLDASLAMGVADLCVSFPFTSTTNEALAARVPAIWHDPQGKYRKTPYAKQGNLVTHGFDELRWKILQMKTGNPDPQSGFSGSVSPLLDPFGDGRAIDRFRELLVSH